MGQRSEFSLAYPSPPPYMMRRKTTYSISLEDTTVVRKLQFISDFGILLSRILASFFFYKLGRS